MIERKPKHHRRKKLLDERSRKVRQWEFFKPDLLATVYTPNAKMVPSYRIRSFKILNRKMGIPVIWRRRPS